MDTGSQPFRFPVELADALARIRFEAGRRHGFIVERRTTRRALRAAQLDEALLWQVIESLSEADYCEGPMQDHHCLDRQLWVFGPIVGGRKMYLKVGFRSHGTEREMALVIWSFHPPRYPMRRHSP
jgi:hypothetical protein